MRNARLGVHQLVFGDSWTQNTAEAATAAAAEIGFDLFEVLILDPSELDVAMTGRVVSAAGLGLRLGMALGPDADISSPFPDVARNGEATIARCLEIAAELGVPSVSGITYAAFNNYSAAPTAEQRSAVLGHGLVRP